MKLVYVWPKNNFSLLFSFYRRHVNNSTKLKFHKKKKRMITTRRRTLLKVIILGDSGSVFFFVSLFICIYVCIGLCLCMCSLYNICIIFCFNFVFFHGHDFCRLNNKAKKKGSSPHPTPPALITCTPFFLLYFSRDLCMYIWLNNHFNHMYCDLLKI